MQAQSRTQKIEAYGKAHEALLEALEDFPKEMWTWKTSPEVWSIHDNIVHIADSEANSFIRCRRLIAEPGEAVTSYDENGWMRALNYGEQSAEDAIELFKWLRGNTYKLIKSLPEETWAHTIQHPENGTMTMDDWLHVYERHVPEHISQMRERYRQWLERK